MGLNILKRQIKKINSRELTKDRSSSFNQDKILSFKSIFLVSCKLKYSANTPWFSVGLPFGIENIKKLKFMNVSGEIIYTTDYNVVENALESIIQLVAHKSEIAVEYTYSKNNKFYNESWIKEQFGDEEYNSFINLLKQRHNIIKTKVANSTKLILLAVVLLLCVIMLSVLLVVF